MHCYICLVIGMACIVISVWVKEWHALLYQFGKGVACIVTSVCVKEWHALLYLFG